MKSLLLRILCWRRGYHVHDRPLMVSWERISEAEMECVCRCGAKAVEYVREGIEHRYRCAAEGHS